MSTLPRSDAVTVPLAVARSAQADKVRESVRLAVAFDTERSKGLDVVNVQRLPKLDRRDVAVHAAPISLAGFTAGSTPRRTVRKLPLGVAVPPVPVLLALRSAAVTERLAVTGFRAEPSSFASPEQERLPACVTGAVDPCARAPGSVIAGLRAELAAPEFQVGRLYRERGAASLAGHGCPVSSVGVAAGLRAEQGFAPVDFGRKRLKGAGAMLAGTMYAHQGSASWCRAPGLLQQVRGLRAPTLYHDWGWEI